MAHLMNFLPRENSAEIDLLLGGGEALKEGESFGVGKGHPGRLTLHSPTFYSAFDEHSRQNCAYGCTEKCSFQLSPSCSLPGGGSHHAESEMRVDSQEAVHVVANPAHHFLSDFGALDSAPFDQEAHFRINAGDEGNTPATPNSEASWEAPATATTKKRTRLDSKSARSQRAPGAKANNVNKPTRTTPPRARAAAGKKNQSSPNARGRPLASSQPQFDVGVVGGDVVSPSPLGPTAVTHVHPRSMLTADNESADGGVGSSILMPHTPSPLSHQPGTPSVSMCAQGVGVCQPPQHANDHHYLSPSTHSTVTSAVAGIAPTMLTPATSPPQQQQQQKVTPTQLNAAAATLRRTRRTPLTQPHAQPSPSVKHVRGSSSATIGNNSDSFDFEFDDDDEGEDADESEDSGLTPGFKGLSEQFSPQHHQHQHQHEHQHQQGADERNLKRKSLSEDEAAVSDGFDPKLLFHFEDGRAVHFPQGALVQRWNKFYETFQRLYNPTKNDVKNMRVFRRRLQLRKSSQKGRHEQRAKQELLEQRLSTRFNTIIDVVGDVLVNYLPQDHHMNAAIVSHIRLALMPMFMPETPSMDEHANVSARDE